MNRMSVCQLNTLLNKLLVSLKEALDQISLLEDDLAKLEVLTPQKPEKVVLGRCKHSSSGNHTVCTTISPPGEVMMMNCMFCGKLINKEISS